MGSEVGRLDSLTGMRFIAALLVVLHHTVRNPVATTGLVSLPVLRPFAAIGYSGVTFFFVLSGFVLTWSSTGSAQAFYARRFARIYPLHLLTWAFSFVLLWQLARPTTPGAAGFGAVLLQAWSPNSATAFGQNGVSWSLSCEAFFYASFPLLVAVLKRQSQRAIVATLATVVALLAVVPVAVFDGFGSRATGQYLHYLPAYRIGEFVVGICLALLVRRGVRWFPSIGVTTVCAAVWFGAVAVLNMHARGIVPGSGPSGLPQVATGLAVLPAASVWIVAAANADLRGAPSVLRSRVLRRLGMWSFALYITHALVVREIELGLGGHAPASALGRVVLEAGVVGLVVAISAFVFRFVERPVERILRRRLHAEATTRSARGDSSAAQQTTAPSQAAS